MKPFAAILVGLATGALLLGACGGGDGKPEVSSIDPADFQAKVDNPLFPLASLGPKVFEGEERDPETSEVIETRLESTVLPDTDVVAGVEVTVVEEKDYEDGELIESTLKYSPPPKDGKAYHSG